MNARKNTLLIIHIINRMEYEFGIKRGINSEQNVQIILTF